MTRPDPIRFQFGLRAFLVSLWLVPFLAAVTVASQVAAQVDILDDNAASIAVVIGNRDYRQTVPVDYAHNDADAIQDYLVNTLGFRSENVFLLRDGTLSELTQMFGSENSPQSGRLWRSVTPGASNVFVYYSGHGVPDLVSGEPFLLPADGDPNSAVSGYRLDTLYRNLELVRHKVGPDRDVIVMIDACFTGETGRGESLLAVSSPGFLPAMPDTGEGVIRLVATSGASPANWDDTVQLGLFTSRFLMGAAGLADDDGPVDWENLSDYLVQSVSSQALRDSGRSQHPEIDMAALALPQGDPVSFVSDAVISARDRVAWDAAQDDRAALERYIAECEACGFRTEALAELASIGQGEAAQADRTLWQSLSATSDFQGYLDQCGRTCAYSDVARSYLGAADPATDIQVARCDALAAAPGDALRPADVPGVPWSQIDGFTALEACTAATRSYPNEPRLHFQQARALDRLGRYAEAMTIYQRAFELGSYAALNNIGTLTENGEGVPSDPARAFDIYVAAARGGDVLAMTNAGRMLEYGRGTPQDVPAAIRYYQQAADTGDGFAITKLASFYTDGQYGITPDPQRAMALFRQGIDANEPLAMITAAVLIDNGFASEFPGTTSLDLVLETLAHGETGVTAVVASTSGDQNLSPATIRALQQQLTDQQFYTGERDGTFNPLFIRALDAYARSASSQRND